MNQNKKATSPPAKKNTNAQQQVVEGTNVNIGSPAKKNTNTQQAAERPFANVNIDSASDQGLNKGSPKRNTNVQAAEGSSAARRNITPERVQLIKEKYKNIRIPLRIQTVNKEREEVNQSINERPNDDNNVLSGQYLEYIINRI